MATPPPSSIVNTTITPLMAPMQLTAPSAAIMLSPPAAVAGAAGPQLLVQPVSSSSSSSREDRQVGSKSWAQRGMRFNEKHCPKYGLSICSRNAKTGLVESVMCKFCVAFGKESASDSTRKRRATANIKYFRSPFRADHYVSHLEINHKDKWNEYERATGPERDKFFSAHLNGEMDLLTGSMQLLPQGNRFSKHGRSGNASNVHASSAGNATTGSSNAGSSGGVDVDDDDDGLLASPLMHDIGSVRLPATEIERSVVHVLVGDLFFNPHDEPSATQAQALDVFVAKDMDSGSNTNGTSSTGSTGGELFDIVIKNQRLFDLAIKFVACGASFRLAARMIQCTKEETKAACYRGCTDHKVAGYVRAVIASNLQKVAQMMRASWGYAIATDAACHQSTSYLDIRVRLWQSGAVQDFHLMTLPTFEQLPAPSIVERLECCLNILDSNWRAKLLGTSTNGGVHTGRNTGMTGSQQGLAARLTSLVTKPGFYLIWCGVHQLELVVKNALADFCQKAFYNEVVTVFATLRQDHHGVFENQDIPDVTASYSSTRGFAQTMLSAFKWLMEQRIPVTQYFQSVLPASQPSASWWICVAVAHRILAEVEYFMKKLVGMEAAANPVSEHVQELCKLALIMSDVVGARRDLWDHNDMEDACAAGSFLLTYQNAQQFIQNEGGPLAIDMFDTLRGVERLHISKSVALFVVDLIAGVATVAQEGRHYCAENSGVIVNPPNVLPYAVYEMGKDAFMALLHTQHDRLRETFTEEDIKGILSDYEHFVTAVDREPILNGILKKHGRKTDVSFAWSCVNGRFRLLQEFIGGLASAVPEVAAGTLASDLTQLNWEKPDYRQTMVDFSLEGILHAKQKTKIELVDISYLHSLSALSTTSTSAPSSPTLNGMNSGIPMGLMMALGGQDSFSMTDSHSTGTAQSSSDGSSSVTYMVV